MHGFMLRRGSPFLPGGSIRLRKHRRRERGIGRRACRSGGGTGIFRRDGGARSFLIPVGGGRNMVGGWFGLRGRGGGEGGGGAVPLAGRDRGHRHHALRLRHRKPYPPENRFHERRGHHAGRLAGNGGGGRKNRRAGERPILPAPRDRQPP